MNKSGKNFNQLIVLCLIKLSFRWFSQCHSEHDLFDVRSFEPPDGRVVLQPGRVGPVQWQERGLLRGPGRSPPRLGIPEPGTAKETTRH